MPKKISKTEAIKSIDKSDALEVITETINRSETTSNKQRKLREFSYSVQRQVLDERDVILIAVKVK